MYRLETQIVIINTRNPARIFTTLHGLHIGIKRLNFYRHSFLCSLMLLIVPIHYADDTWVPDNYIQVNQAIKSSSYKDVSNKYDWKSFAYTSPVPKIRGLVGTLVWAQIHCHWSGQGLAFPSWQKQPCCHTWQWTPQFLHSPAISNIVTFGYKSSTYLFHQKAQ